jgi:hypothetical protein
MSESEDLDLAERVAERLRASEPVDPTFDTRLMSAARAAAARGEVAWFAPNDIAARRDRRAWLTRPRQIGVSPLAGLAAAAVFAAIVVGTTLAVSRGRATDGVSVVAASDQSTTEVVRFVIVAPSARGVSLVGDFNGWNPAATPLARGTGDSTWVVTVSLAPGKYQYAFVLDGQAWLADPSAPISVEDDLGTPSSLLTVADRRRL